MKTKLQRENARVTVRRWLRREGQFKGSQKVQQILAAEAVQDVARLAGYLGVDVALVRADVEAGQDEQD